MTYVDLSLPIRPEMPTNRPDHFPPSVTRYADVGTNGWAGSELTIDTHCGTHVDAPAHFFDGATSVDQIPLDVLTGPAQRIAVDAARPDHAIGADQLAAVTAKRVVLHTGWSERLVTREEDYFAHSPYLSHASADLLVQAGVVLVGIDAPSVDRPGGSAIHRRLLGTHVVVVENLTNTAYLPDAFELLVAPLPVVGGDGAPARVLARVGG